MTTLHTLLSPSSADIDALARAAFGALPNEVRARCGDLVLVIEEFADDATLDALDIDDPFDLTGLYEGTDLRHDSDSGALPPRVVLYRRAILEEWIERGNVTLGELVSHVLVHEVAHHVGLSDADIAAIDDWTR